MTAEAPPPPKRALWIVLPIAVAMALFILLLATREPAVDRVDDSPLVGRLAPSIVAPTIDGDMFDLDQQRGRFVVVNFFATTCVPCRLEHPELVDFQQTYGPSGFANVVSISFDDSEANIREFFSEFGGGWPVIATDTGSLAVSFGVAAVPESIIVADTGEVIAKLVGGITKENLESVIGRFQQAEADT